MATEDVVVDSVFLFIYFFITLMLLIIVASQMSLCVALPRLRHRLQWWVDGGEGQRRGGRG